MDHGAAASLSPTSPVSARSHVGANGGPKRKRSVGGLASTIDSSPGSPGLDDDHGDHHEKKRQPGVKRACNECRQQKLRCDVVQDPFQGCTRCGRLKLECKIESNFKRVGKRSKHAEMEKEIDMLRRAVQRARTAGFIDEDDSMHSQLQSPIVNNVYSHTRNPSLMGSEEAVSSLLHLKRGYTIPRIVRSLDEVQLTEDAEAQLFDIFFRHYHPTLPFLNPQMTPEAYYQQHTLLYWVIVAIASRRYPADPTLLGNISRPLTQLLWSTIGEVPGNYCIVKALCLLCTWPLPTSTSSADPTHILCGVMMKIATGIGLHRPMHINDFSRVQIELNKEQLHDRVTTWAVCNIVAQTIGTGYGQPASTLYDWTLAVRPGDNGPFQLSAELEARLQIERFCDKVSKEMYSNASDPRGVAGDEHRSILMRVFRREYSELNANILSRDLSPVVNLHLKAAGLHLRLAAFFDSSKTQTYVDDLKELFRATTSFLDAVLEGDYDTNPQEQGGNDTLKYATNYIQQMLVATGFVLLKLMRSFFAKIIDFERGRLLFHRTSQAIRATSVNRNDLSWRLAELMVQMWNGARVDPTYMESGMIDDSLQLKVRCRHSMSLVFDSIWAWREDYEARGRGSLDALKNPTNPDSANESSASSTHLDTTLMPPSHGLTASLIEPTPAPANSGGLTPLGASGLSGNSNNGGTQNSAALLTTLGGYDANATAYDFFDPQHWMLDNLVDFGYSFGGVQALET
ncbi:hypothetical protein MCOR27_005405 [Pyricularia oryzae]|uniref:Zn(2)-C6 fungal-type domain-containing protein n=2 Tax=Pyricularia TaxID=48558 RepID=A0ABQ8N8X5_PYRGI|nr:hypothetical protein MCOR01_007419 [Pyricularia oryzae]KAI6292382.1 hypothetical protein MCOR33_009909 [Pyricularia grisea]KAH9433975.1 hypothetical protein MCOR02_006007 [Pyricularia oryzae]KAI6260222.1 hypothetical protein MCOR19_003455 [Pyricularia oryzae]KAI6278858.1 hypothetical protein MCOR27_005405 [Pyricularia oryzae]